MVRFPGKDFAYRACPPGLAAGLAGAALAAFVAFTGGIAGAAPSHRSGRDPAVIGAGEPLLGRLTGAWVLTGTIAGKPVTHDVTAEWTLHRNYVRVGEVARERDAQGRPAYEATIFVGWQRRTGNYVCIWLDSTAVAGGGSTCTARPEPNAIPFVFRDAKGRTFFENTFLYDVAADRWTWTLDDVDQGKRTPFARLSLRRK